MKKDYVIARLGNIATVARVLGLTSPAISQWPDDVPARRAYELQELLPGLFPREGGNPYRKSRARKLVMMRRRCDDVSLPPSRDTNTSSQT